MSTLLLSKGISCSKAKKHGVSLDVHASSRDFLVADFIFAIKRVYILYAGISAHAYKRLRGGCDTPRVLHSLLDY